MFLIGADPEFFVRRGNVFISGHTFECGTKAEPMKTKHGAVQVDGVALEANIIPAKSKEEFISNILGVIGDLNEIVAGKGCKIVAQPTVTFKSKYIQALPPEVRALGCNPDYNAYTFAPNDAPNAEVNFRTGAGHIHIGWTEGKEHDDFEHFTNCCVLARQMDYFVGLRTLKFDRDNQRRELYGKAGAFRPKPYGMEYRVPSSVWASSEKLMGEVYDATIAACEFANADGDLDKTYQGFAQYAINKNITDWDELNPEVAKEIGYAAVS
jgi:hypothetical protein